MKSSTLKKKSCAIRTIYTQNYANIFVRNYERNFMYPIFQTFSNFYCQCNDDIFLLWNGSKTHLLDFITRLNIKEPTNLILNIQNPASSFNSQNSTKTKRRANY